jgi:hypothetical protein
MAELGQTEKYSERADIFRSSADNRHPRRRLGLVQAEWVFSLHIQYSANAPSRAPCPRLSRLKVLHLLAGWKLDSFLLIRYRPRDPVCVRGVKTSRPCDAWFCA